LVAAGLSFACSEPEPGEDSMVLFQLSMALGVAIAGNALALWPLLALSGGALGLYVLGSQNLTTARNIGGGALSLGSTAVGAYGVALALHVSRHEPLSLFDISLFPADDLSSMGSLGLGLLGGLAAVVGGFPFAFKHVFEWRAMGPRRAAAGLGLGPGAVALFIWLRVSVHGREALQAAMASDHVRWVLYGAIALGVIVHLTRLILARDPDGLHAAAWGLQWCYGLLALTLGNVDGLGLYAFVAWAGSAALAFGGLALADRIPPWASIPLRVASWASLLGAPPLAGFWARYILIRSVSRVHGDWWMVCLLPWLVEIVTVVVFFGWVLRRPGTAARQEVGASQRNKPAPEDSRPAARVAATAWTTLCLSLQLLAGPLSLHASDALARQIVTGATWGEMAREVTSWLPGI
jgi:hypothetical protein